MKKSYIVPVMKTVLLSGHRTLMSVSDENEGFNERSIGSLDD